MHMSPHSSNNNSTTPSSSSYCRREGTNTFPPPPLPSAPVVMRSPTAFISSDDDAEDRDMENPSSHHTTRIEILKDAPASNSATKFKARRRSASNVKKEKSPSSNNSSCLPLHVVRSSSAVPSMVKSPSTVPSKYLYKPSRSMTPGRGENRNVLPSHYSPKRKSRVNTHFAIFASALVLLAFFSYKRTFVMHEQMNKYVEENSSRVENLSTTVEEMNREIEIHRKRMKTLQQMNADLERSKLELEQEHFQMKNKLENTMATEDEKKLLEENKLLQNEVKNLKVSDNNAVGLMKQLIDKIQRDSYRDVYERFGPGPHFVKFDVAIPGRGFNPSTMATFTIKLHPIDIMPHSVHLFLEQVYHGLWNDCAFVINSPEVIQAGALPRGNDGKTYKEKMSEFEEMGLSKIHFQEYNNAYPHKKWTVGFAGRPGGPDFYVNMMDNTKLNGPGGQTHYSVNEEADPCFGEIVEGRDALEKMYSLPVDDNNFKPFLKKPVHITKATILGMEETLAGADEHHVPRDMKDKHFIET